MAEFILKDRNGKGQTFNTDAIFVQGTDGELVQFTQGTGSGSDVTLLENLPFELDFASGDMSFEAPNGYAVKSAIVKKPDTLIPANIKSGVEVAGITGTLSGGGANPDANDPVYYVTFMNGDQVLYVRPVVSGDACPDVKAKGWITTPTKESDAQYNYTYYGWGDSSGAYDANILKNIQKDKTVYATYTSTLRSYTVTFYDEDGTTVLNSNKWLYGETPSYSISKPGFKPTWIPEITSVTGDASYTLQYVALEGEPFGDNCVFSFKDGVLTIDGSGAMPDYVYNTYTQRPWESQTAYITSVVIGDGVTTIGSCVFDGSTALTSITIPSSVTSIGDRAFRMCSSLTSVDIPDSVTYMGQSVFSGCSSLTSVDIPDGVTVLKMCIFQDCTSLVSVSIPNSVTAFEASALRNCGFTSIDLPGGLTSIASNAFTSCTKLTSITIPASVTKTGNYVFSSCSALTSVTFEDTSGWYVATSSTATSGTNVTLTNPSTNATYFKTTYKNYYWFNPTATA